ncbi:MAG: hypothetical protein AB1831_08555 [Pseudomonadota bacterium]
MRYALHGLILDSPFPCPELPPASGVADVVVRLGEIERLPMEWREEGGCYKAASGRYLLAVPGVADYFVEDGKAVTIAPALHADEDALRLFFYHEVMGALLMQRGRLLLKGVAVERDGKAYAFIGPTPAGKTMLAAELCKQGFKLIADGFLCLSDNEGLRIQPGLPRLMLWERSLEELGILHEGLKPVRSGMRRYFLMPGSSFCEQPLSPACVYLLAFSNQEGWSMDTLKGMEKLFVLLPHRLHGELEKGLGVAEAQYRLAARLAGTADIKIIRYNDSHVTFAECIGHLKNELGVTD